MSPLVEMLCLSIKTKVLNNVLIFHRAHQQQGAATAAFGDNGRFLSCSGEFTETAARDTDAGDD